MAKVIKIQDLLNIKEYQKPTSIKLQDLVGKTIVIIDFVAKRSSKYDKAGYKMSILVDKKKYSLYTCSANIVEQLNDIKVKLSELNKTDNYIACKVMQKDKAYYLGEYTSSSSDSTDTENQSDSANSTTLINSKDSNVSAVV